MTASRLATGPLDVPDQVRRVALWYLLDGIGAVRPVLTIVRDLGGPAEAAVLGDSRPIGAPAAVLADGAHVHGLDFDDSHAGGDPPDGGCAAGRGRGPPAAGRVRVGGSRRRRRGIRDRCLVTAAALYGFDAWGHLFFTGHKLLAKISSPLIGPLVAVASFVCLIGNVQLAGMLWQVTARLIVRRVRDANPGHVVANARANCSPRGATAPRSPTHRSLCCRPRPTTAATRSSNRSSPT